jgi:hypothetical protein
MALLYPLPAQLLLGNTIQAITPLCEIGLYQNNITLTPAVVLSDLEAATFSGYTIKTLTTGFSEAYFSPTGDGAEIRSGEVQFFFTAPTPPTLPVTNTIYGFYCKTATGDLLVVGNFDAPIAMLGDGDAVFVNIVLGFGANG